MLLLIAGTRPNFMKIAPIFRALQARSCDLRLLHTGQHFDDQMSAVFFHDLGLRHPDVQLSVGGGSHAEQTARVLVGVEKDLIEHRPAAVIVVGDVTSTIAAALAASKLGVPVVHVEAGLRSRDWNMPEEINRVLTDQLSDLLLTPSADARPNLLAEGIPEERIVQVGNVMIDSLRYAVARPTDVLERLTLDANRYALATLHRPANVDTTEALTNTLLALGAIALQLPVVLPLHPRTAGRMRSEGLLNRFESLANLRIVAPLGYNDFVTLMSHAQLVATDSGGIQEETTALGIPCLTMRASTERPITVDEGTNIIVGLEVAQIDTEVQKILAGNGKKGRVPSDWDGRAAERVADAIERFLGGNPPPKAQMSNSGTPIRP